MTALIGRLLAVVSLMVLIPAQAHTGLAAVTPENGAVVNHSPEQLRLNYSGEVFPLSVELEGEADRNIDFGFVPSAEASSRFSWDLPRLSPGEYRIKWQVMGQDGHKMSGESTFTVATSAQ